MEVAITNGPPVRPLADRGGLAAAGTRCPGALSLKAESPAWPHRLAPGETRLKQQVTFPHGGYYQLGPCAGNGRCLRTALRRFRCGHGAGHLSLVCQGPAAPGLQPGFRGPSAKSGWYTLFEDPQRLAAIRPISRAIRLNRIHWRATARTGQIHSRVYENSRVAGATFLLDFHQQSFQGSGAAASAELAIVTSHPSPTPFPHGEQIGFVSNGATPPIAFARKAGAPDSPRARTRTAGPPNRRPTPPAACHRGNGKAGTVIPANSRKPGALEHTDGLEFSAMLAEAACRIPRTPPWSPCCGG